MIAEEKIAGINFIEIDFDPFAGADIEKVVPTTESQKEIWASCILGGEDASRGFNESISLRLKGWLDRQAFENAFKKLVYRNDSLRSVISTNGRQICVLKVQDVSIAYKDISDNTAQEQKAVLAADTKQDALHLFDLANGPLFKAALVKLSPVEHQLILTTHHIICDGWSLGVMMQDLSKMYSAYAQNVFVEFQEAPRFSDYANQQQDFIKSSDYNKIEEFWLGNFQDDIPVLKLPTDFERPALRTYKSSRLDYSLDKQLVSELKKVGVKGGASFVITLMAAFEIFLQRLTGQDDIVIGLPAAGQSATGNYKLIGHCVNLLPLRSRQKSELGFVDFLKYRKGLIYDCYENQQITFGSLLKKLKIARDASTVPLIPVVFNIDIGLTDGVDFYGLDFELISNPREYENFEIFLNVTGSNEDFTLEWSYNTQLFKPETIDRMMSGFKTVIKTIVSDPFLPLKDILLTDRRELVAKLQERNNTAVDYQNRKFLTELIAATAVLHPNKIALVYADQDLSFKKLNEKTNQFAQYILAKGIEKGDVVAISMDRSIEMVISLLAIMKTGAAFLPVDPELPAERSLYMLNDSSARLIITSSKYKGRFTKSVIEVLAEDALAEAEIHPVSDPDIRITGNDLAYIIYTSGSTGQPKGVLIRHAAILNYIQTSILSYSSTEPQNTGSFFHLSLSFDASLTALFVPLITGKPIVISSEKPLEVFNDDNLIKYSPFDFIKLTPSQLILLSNSKNDSAKHATKKYVVGGEVLHNRHFDFLVAGKVKAEIVNEYGPTEATVGCISYTFNVSKPLNYSSNGVLIGRPMPNVRIYILDKYLNPVPDGFEGEIFISGVQVARGYLNRAALNDEKFIPDPFTDDPDDRMYRSGDLGKYTTNGEIEFLGRADQQIKLRGYRIEPGEIEHVLTKQRGIKQAAVIVREENVNDKRLVAYVVTENQLTDTEFGKESDTWKKALKEKLPVYMVPAEYINLQEIPMTVNGKINSAELQKPSRKKNEAVTAQSEPLTEVQKIITRIWEEVLNNTSIAIDDDFFEIGGHSLTAIEMMARLEKQTGIKLPVSTLLEYSTIYKLASVIEKGTKVNKWKSLVALRPAGNKPPVYIVHGAGLGVLIFKDLVSHLDEDQPVYGLQALGLDGSDEPLEEIERFAAHYISEILQQNPSGPYSLAGLSHGGIIAFEMARQLKAMNKEVRMLGIFDTNIETPLNQYAAVSKIKKIIERLVPRLSHEMRAFFKYPKKAFNYQLVCFKNRFIALQERLGLEEENDINHTHYYIDKAIHKHAMALAKYKMKPYEGSIDLFRSEIKVYYIPDLEFLGWKPYISKDIKIHNVPGDHDDMILPPYSKIFARTLQNALDNS